VKAMRSKLNYLIGISLKRKIKTKWFVIANAILAVVIMGIINVDSIINFFGGDFGEKQKIYVVDNTTIAYDLFDEQIKQSNNILKGNDSEPPYEVILYDKSLDEAKKLVEESKKNMVLVFDVSEDNIMEATLITEGYIDTIDYQLISNAINNTKIIIAIQESNISPDEFSKIYSPIEIKRVYIDENKKSEDEGMEMIMATVFPVIILPFFMLTIFLVQMIGAEVNDEKTTRGMEIIISNVSPKTHFFAKVIAGNLFVLFQGLLLFTFGSLGLLIRKLIGGNEIVNGLGEGFNNIISKVLETGLGEQLVLIIPLALILMILTFIAYSLLAGILASMTTNIEDFQQLQTPIIIISLIGYYLAMMAGMFEGAAFIRALSYVPLISAILSPSLLVLGQIGVIDVVISIVITLGFNYVLIKYGLKIYKVGILNYSSSDLWKKMFKAIKN
jgi:ABC-2 type transport system permease protein